MVSVIQVFWVTNWCVKCLLFNMAGFHIVQMNARCQCLEWMVQFINFLPYCLLCFQCFLIIFHLIYWILQLQNLVIVSITLVKYFCSLILFLSSLNCLSEFSWIFLVFVMTAILNPLAKDSMTLSLIAEELSFSLLLCYLVVHVINVWCIWSSEHLISGWYLKGLSFQEMAVCRATLSLTCATYTPAVVVVVMGCPCCVWVTYGG